jgi:hypothetical protein
MSEMAMFQQLQKGNEATGAEILKLLIFAMRLILSLVVGAVALAYLISD